MTKYSQQLATAYSENKERFNETDRKLIENLETLGIKDKMVVDLGCGDGSHARLLKGMGATSVIGVDASEEMIALARKKISEPSVDFLVADGRNIPIESASADIVLSNFVIHYFPNTEEVFQEIKRVLKIGGYFVGTLNITNVDPGFEHLYNQYMPVRLGQDEHFLIVQNLIKSHEEVAKAIRAASFEVLKEEELDHPKATVDDSFALQLKVHKHATLFVLRRKPDEALESKIDSRTCFDLT